MGLLGWVNACWYWRQRRVDLKILWPACVEQAPNIEEARAVFALHAYDDPAWLALPPEELTRRLHALKDPAIGKFVVIPGVDLMKQ